MNGEATPAHGVDILVVDDLPENSRLLARLLEPLGYQVHAARNGAQALDFVANQAPDLILLDLVMPEMDGFEVCQRLKGNEATRHIPVVVITGRKDREANLLAIEAGADDFLVKPFDQALLKARIGASLNTKMLQDQLLDSRRRLEERVRERTAQLEKTQQVTIFSLAKLAESRDNETGDHLDRMRCYAKSLALEMQAMGIGDGVLTDHFVESLYLSCPLHDIGKVGIPDRILLKPGRLTEAEFEIMRTHARIGGDTLRAAEDEAGGAPFLAMGRDIAYFHHEKWDGTGYPFRQEGREIPLSARIVALADVYDALSSKRPYKDPFPHEKCRRILIEGRASHFDPIVVDAFLAREAEFLDIHREFVDSAVPSPTQQLIDSLEEKERSGKTEA